MTWFFLTIVAIILIAMEAIFEKKTLTGAKSLEFAAMFAFGNAIILTPFVFVADLSQINMNVLGVIFLISLPSAGVSLLAFKTIKHNQLSEAAPILALSPLFVALFSFMILGEKMTMLQLVGLFVMVVGMMFLELRNFKLSSGIFIRGRGRYIIYILLYLLLGGLLAIFDRAILFNYKINPLSYLIIIQLCIAANFAMFFFSKPHLMKSLKSSIGQSWKIVLLISIMTVSHRYMYASAIQVATSMGMVVAVYKLSSLFHVFSGGKIFAEDRIAQKVIASIIILSGTVLLIVS